MLMILCWQPQIWGVVMDYQEVLRIIHWGYGFSIHTQIGELVIEDDSRKKLLTSFQTQIRCYFDKSLESML